MSSQGKTVGEEGSSSRTTLGRQQQPGSVASERHTGNLPRSQTAHVHSQAAAPSQTDTSLVRNDASLRRIGNPPERVLRHVQGPPNATGQTNTSSVQNGAPSCYSGNSSQSLHDHVPIQSNKINQTNSTTGKGTTLGDSKLRLLISHDHVPARSFESGQTSTFASNKGAYPGGTSANILSILQDHVPNEAGRISGTNFGEPKRSSDSLNLLTGKGTTLGDSKLRLLISHDHVPARSFESGQTSTFDPKCLSKGVTLGGSIHTSQNICDHAPKTSVPIETITTFASNKGATLGVNVPRDLVSNKDGRISGTNSGGPK